MTGAQAAEYRTEVRAAVLREPGTGVRLERLRLREPGPADVRVRIDVTGVCHSDLSVARGVIPQPRPAVLGHEACGTVVAAGREVTSVRAGDRVILLWITPCGACPHCARGEPYLCETGSSRSAIPHAIDEAGQPVYPGLTVGSFAEQTVVPAAAVVPVPGDISSADAALLGCAVTTGVGAVIKTARVQPGSTVVVLGLGGVGLSAVLGAKLAGAAQIIAVDRLAGKAGAAARAGADHFVLADDGLKAAVRALSGSGGADYAFDCVGSARTIREAWSLTRRGGTACVVGVGARDDMVRFGALELFHFARTLTGCVAGSLDAHADFPRFFGWLREGKLDLGQLVTGHAALADVNRALADLATGTAIRTLVEPGGGAIA